MSPRRPPERPSARGLAAVACLVALGCGCGGSEGPGDQPAPSSRHSRGPRMLESQQAAQVQPEAQPSDAVAAKPVAVAPTAAPAPEPEAAPEEKPERDLGAELSSAVGNVTSCLKPRLVGSGGPTTLTVSLEAVLTETGIVTRSNARGSGLDAGETECVRKRLDGARLRPPIEGAPRTVNTTITLTLTAPPPAKPGAAAAGTATGAGGAAPPATGSP